MIVIVVAHLIDVEDGQNNVERLRAHHATDWSVGEADEGGGEGVDPRVAKPLDRESCEREHVHATRLEVERDGRSSKATHGDRHAESGKWARGADAPATAHWKGRVSLPSVSCAYDTLAQSLSCSLIVGPVCSSHTIR